MKPVNLAPNWMGLARIILEDLKRSDLASKDFAITLLTNACEKLDDLNDRADKHAFVELDNCGDNRIGDSNNNCDDSRKIIYIYKKGRKKV